MRPEPQASASDALAHRSSTSAFALLPSDLSCLVELAAYGNQDDSTAPAHTPQSQYEEDDEDNRPIDPLAQLQRIGGVEGLAKLLDVDLRLGLNALDHRDLCSRQDWFGSNHILLPPQKSLLRLMYEAALLDTTNLILVIDGAFAVALGLAVGKDPSTDWMEGACVLLAVFVIALVAGLTDYQKETQFRRLNAVNENEVTQVRRNALSAEVRKWDLVVGDVVRLSVGDIVSADGIVFDAHELQADESMLTGESDLVSKDDKHQPFVFAGTKIMQGFADMLVLCVGVHAQSGKITALINGNSEVNVSDHKADETKKAKKRQLSQLDENGSGYVEILTPRRQSKGKKADQRLNDDDSSTTDAAHDIERSPLSQKILQLNLMLSKIGVILALFVMLLMSIRFSITTFVLDDEPWRAAYLQEYLSYFILATTILVVAIPEGLPLAVAIALAHSVQKMLAENNLVRHLHACEIAGNATTICSDKTGTLTTNCMTVMKVWMHGINGDNQDETTEMADFESNIQMGRQVTATAKQIFFEGIAVNSTADVNAPTTEDAVPQFTGNKTECAMLQFVLGCDVDYRVLRKQAVLGHVIPFSSERKRMSVVVSQHDENGKCRIYTKGASEVVLQLCTQFLSTDGSVRSFNGDTKELAQMQTAIRSAVIDQYASQGYRTLCLAYRDIQDSPMDEVSKWSEDRVEANLTCIAIVAIEDPVRPGVPNAIQVCERAGIIVRMVTGDNVLTAQSIARKCGILSSDLETDGAVMEGWEFRARVLDARGRLRQQEFDKLWPKLRVLARSSPTDKYVLVRGLMQTMGSEETGEGAQLVAVTGDGTNDAPALKKAHVGFAMGVCGTSVAKESSDIILMDDNFASIVTAIKYGRNVYDSICKFLQFQLTVIIVAIVLAVVGAILWEQSPITAVQILWVNLFMDSFASLALATEPPTPELLNRMPYSRDTPLISKKMVKHIIGQASFQLLVLLLLTLEGDKWFQIASGLDTSEEEKGPTQHLTIVFNAFVWLQLFNEFNCRGIHDSQYYVFDASLWTNKLFVGGWIVQVAFQALVVQFGGSLFHTAPLNPTQWAVCIVIGVMTLPLGVVLRWLNLDLC